MRSETKIDQLSAKYQKQNISVSKLKYYYFASLET